MTTSPRSCRKATELISLSMERPLTRAERRSLRLHMLICRPCRVFRSHVRQLRSILRQPTTPRLPTSFMDGVLSDEARERIRARLGA